MAGKKVKGKKKKESTVKLKSSFVEALGVMVKPVPPKKEQKK